MTKPLQEQNALNVMKTIIYLILISAQIECIMLLIVSKKTQKQTDVLNAILVSSLWDLQVMD